MSFSSLGCNQKLMVGACTSVHLSEQSAAGLSNEANFPCAVHAHQLDRLGDIYSELQLFK